MAKAEFSDDEMKLEIEYDSDCFITGEPFRDLLKALLKLHKKVTLTKFSLDKVEEPNVYTYSFQARDGRVWNQTLHITHTDTGMTFDVQEPWHLSEFILHRDLRDKVIEVVLCFGVHKIESEFE